MLTVRDGNKFDWASISLADCVRGNAMDSHFTLKVFHVLKERLDEMEVSEFYEKVLAPANTVFVEPEWSGITVCPHKIKSIGRSLNDTIIDVHDSMYEYSQINKYENLSSSRDLQGILYTKEKGFAFYPPDKTEKGAPSVSAPTLEILLGQIKKEIISRG